ncbi:MAG: hypothetical protein WBE34_20725, partial [Candidatus Nitrosopolaris sp.]
MVEGGVVGGRRLLLLLEMVTGEFVDGIVVEGILVEGGVVGGRTLLLLLEMVTGEFVDGIV